MIQGMAVTYTIDLPFFCIYIYIYIYIYINIYIYVFVYTSISRSILLSYNRGFGLSGIGNCRTRPPEVGTMIYSPESSVCQGPGRVGQLIISLIGAPCFGVVVYYSVL